jgi:hypothetical protein
MTQSGHLRPIQVFFDIIDEGRMKPASWHEVAELIGITAIVASLIFVGLELRQTREIALSEAYQMRAAIEIANATAMASIPGYLTSKAKLYDGGSISDLTTEEYIAHEHYLVASLGVWENDHYQYERGYLSEEHWKKAYGNMLCDFSLSLYREIYASSGWTYRKSFAEEVEQAITEAKSDPLGCWSEIGSQ